MNEPAGCRPENPAHAEPVIRFLPLLKIFISKTTTFFNIRPATILAAPCGAKRATNTTSLWFLGQ